MRFINTLVSTVLIAVFSVSSLCGVSAQSEDGYTMIFSDDFEKYSVGDVPDYASADISKWTKVVRSTESPITVGEESGNKFLSIQRIASAAEAGGPRMEKLIPVNDDTKLTVRCKVRTNSQVFQLSVRSADTKTYTNVINFSGDDVLSRTPNGIELSPEQYVSVAVDINCRTMRYSTYINGFSYITNGSLNNGLDFSEGLLLRFGTSVSPGHSLYLDDVEILSDDKSLSEGKFLNIYELETDSDTLLTPYIKKSHPRIYVTDFEEIRNKIATDQMTARWYEYVKTSADGYLNSEPEPYAPESGILTNVSRRVMYKLYTLAFVYAIEQNPVYKDRAIEEIVNAGNYPSWHPNNFLGVGEMGGGIAVAYDWMYNGMTDAERETVRNVIINKTLYLGALSYEGISDTFFVTATSNWNFVCNGGLVLSALAVSDEFPKLADYIFNRAAESIPRATEAIFGTGGASPEGAGYWEYAAYNFIDMIAALESATSESGTLPSKFDFSGTQGLSETLAFPIATHSTVGRFNYGDNVPAYGQTMDLNIAYWAAKKYNKPEYAAYQLQTRDKLGAFGMPWKTVLKIIWYDPDEMSGGETDFPLDKSYTSDDGPNLISLRSSWQKSGETYVGMQGGLNGSPHSFLSLGTFVIDAMGERWATLIGQGNYRWDGYFDMNEQRWTYYNCNTEGQNCVVLNPGSGPQQSLTALAKTVAFESSVGEAYGVLNMTQAYSKDVTDYKRGIKLFDNRSKILIQDDIQAKQPLDSGYWFMHTDANVYIDNGGKTAMLVKNGKRMFAQIISDFDGATFSLVSAKPLPTSQNPLIQQSEDYGQKLSIDLSGAENIKLAVLFTPLEDGEMYHMSDMGITPVSRWKIADTDVDNDNIINNIVGMYINSPYGFRDGQKVKIDSENEKVVPKIENGRTMVPLRFIAEAIGADVVWENASGTAKVTCGSTTAEFSTGNYFYKKNGRSYRTDAAPMVYMNRIFVPVRVFAETFGKKAGWNNGLVTISNYSGIEIDGDITKKLVNKLAYRLYLDGKEVAFFDADSERCDIAVSPLYNGNRKVSIVSSNPSSSVSITRLSPEDERITVDGSTVLVSIAEDPYFYASGDFGLKSVDVTNAAFRDMTGVVTWIPPVSVSASAEATGAVGGICDNKLDTFWSSQGLSTVDFDFGKKRNITAMSVANNTRDGSRKYFFSVEYSDDGVNWKSAAKDLETYIKTDYPQIFDLGSITARFVRLVAQGNSSNEWNIYREVKFYESDEQKQRDSENWDDYFASVDWDSLTKGKSFPLKVTGIRNDGTELKFNTADISFDSSDNGVVSFDGNVLTASGVGKCEITIKINYFGIEELKRISVQVTE